MRVRSNCRRQVWIFNTDIYYSHSKENLARRGIKLYWRLLGVLEEAPPTDRLSPASYEAMELDSEVLKRLAEDLQASAARIPEEMRVQGEWCAGILHRFRDEELAPQ